jgi:hypothetical protein
MAIIMKEIGTLPRDTMVKAYKRLCIRIEAMIEAAVDFY